MDDFLKIVYIDARNRAHYSIVMEILHAIEGVHIIYRDAKKGGSVGVNQMNDAELVREAGNHLVSGLQKFVESVVAIDPELAFSENEDEEGWQESIAELRGKFK